MATKPTSKNNRSGHIGLKKITDTGIFKSYFKTAIRNLLQNKFFTTLNVFGLSLGMALMLVYVAMVVFVFQFDNFHPNKERIYRIITHVHDRNENPSFASVPAGVAQLIEGNVSGIEKVVRIKKSLPAEILYGQNKMLLKGYFADAEYFSIFNFPLLNGNPATALVKPNTMVITEAAANRIFGTKDPMGATVFIEPYGEVMITGVAKDMPKNTHLKAEAVVSFSTLTSHFGASIMNNEKNWVNFYNSYAYVELAGNTEATSIESYLKSVSKEKYKATEFKASFELQRLDKIVPGPELDNDMGNEWSYQEIMLMGILPMIILIVACSNYVSLAISQSLKRVKEIGVRRVMGAEKKHVLMQFVMESTIIMLVALLPSYFLFEIIRNEMLSITNERDMINLNPTAGTFAGFIVFAILAGIFSGLVPALHFSKISTLLALKGKDGRAKAGRLLPLRKLVIVLQFMLSLGFTFAVVVMAQQYRYALNYDLGFDQEKVVDVELQQADAQLVKNEFGKLSFASPVSLSSNLPGAGNIPGIYVKQIGKSDSMKVSRMSVDENFINNIGLQFLLGQNFANDSGFNSHSIIINQVLARNISPDDFSGAIGKMLVLPDNREVRVIGILKDFHYASLQSQVGNFFFEYVPEDFRYANFRLQSTNRSEAFSEMEAAWKSLGTGEKFKAAFLSDQIHDSYSYYNSIMKMWGFMGVLAITLACLGLLGTVVFTIKNRVKEVSIRKVLGASSRGLVLLLSRDFIVLLAIAGIITIPGVYLLMEWTLHEAQYYNAPIGATEILISLAVVLILGLATILSQTMKVANTNPAQNLKIE